MTKIINNTFPKLVTAQILTEYGVRMEKDTLKLLVEDRIGVEVPTERWNQIVEEIKMDSGMIIEEDE